MRRLEREGVRTTLVLVLLIATFVLTAAITLIAQTGSMYHRATSEKVVRDWTRVAQDELLRRVEAMLAFYGTYPVMQSLSMRNDLPTREQLLAAATSDEQRRNARLVIATFRFSNGELFASPGVSPDVQTWLREKLAVIHKAPPMPANREALHVTIGGKSHTFDYLPGERGVIAMEIDRSAVAPFFESAVSIRPLLPESLAQGKITNGKIEVKVFSATPSPGLRPPSPASGRGDSATITARSFSRSAGEGARRADEGVPIFQTPGAFDEQFGLRRTLDKGVLRGFTVETSIARDAARHLVFGGLGPTPPIHLIVLGLAAVLVVTAAYLLRKERQLARMRSEFVAGVSHELRTPLTQIRMFAETLLLDRVRSAEERQRSLTIIDQESRRLAQLVDNILQFSRGERGTLSITRTPRDLGALLRDTVETFAPIAAARNVHIVVHAEEGIIVSIDEDAMRQVILNLLDNGVKYGPEGQEIVAAIEATNGSVRLLVDDAGPGVPKRDRERIWRRYERLPRERERAIAGAGIGLAVVREIVALHGGTVRVEESPRGGSRFLIEVPA